MTIPIIGRHWLYELFSGPVRTLAKKAPLARLWGWKTAGIQQYQSGPPTIIWLTDNNFNPIYFNPLWPLEELMSTSPVPIWFLASTQVSRNSRSFRSRQGYLSMAAFRFRHLYFRKCSKDARNARRFAYLNEDISIIKSTNVNERVSIDFQADFLNIFNRTVFGIGTGGDQYGSAFTNLFNAQSNIP